MKSFEERKRNSKSDLYEQQFFDGIMKKGFSIIDNRSNMNLPDFTIFYDNSKKIYVDVKQYSLGEVAYHRFIQFLQFGKQVYICSYHWKNNKWYLNTIEYLDKIKQGPFPPTLNSSGQSYYSFDESLLTEYKL